MLRRKLFRAITGFSLPEKKQVKQNSHGHLSHGARTTLLHKEAKLGGQLFGEVPQGHNREFFCLDKHTWIWFEEWFDSKEGVMKHINVRYDVQPSGVLKTVDGITRGYVTGEELDHLLASAQQYYKHVATEVYGRTFAVA